MTDFSEARFATAMAAWADAVAALPGWHELVHYRGVSALDVAYLPLYFRTLEQVRFAHDGEAPVVPHEESLGPDSAIARVRRIGRRLRAGELTSAAGLRLAAERTAAWWRPSPKTGLRRTDTEGTALVVRATPNATGFPVLQALQHERGRRVVFASWNRSLEPRVRPLGIDYAHLGDVYAHRLAQWRRRHEHDVAAAIALLDARQLPHLFTEISGEPVAIDVLDAVRDLCCDVRLHTDVYFDLLATVAPAVLLLFNEVSPRDRAAARVASLAGVASVSIQHGLFIGHVYRSLATDAVVVWGTEPRNFWLARGCSADRVISVGGFGHEAWRAHAAAARETQSRTATRCVLVLGQNPAAFVSPALYRRSLAAVIEAAEHEPTLRFVIRPHPGEAPDTYEQVSRARAVPNVEVRAGGDFVPMLLESHVVVSIFSTGGLEAMLLGIPVVVLNPSSEPSLAPYAGAALVADSGRALAQAIGAITRDDLVRARLIDSGRRYADAYFGSIDGRAVHRAAVAIDEIARVALARRAPQFHFQPS